jgi:hypothetical protein
VDEQINEIWYVDITKYYSTIKKNAVISFAGKCIELEVIMLCKIIQTQKDKHHIFVSYVESIF